MNWWWNTFKCLRDLNKLLSSKKFIRVRWLLSWKAKRRSIGLDVKVFSWFWIKSITISYHREHALKERFHLHPSLTDVLTTPTTSITPKYGVQNVLTWLTNLYWLIFMQKKWLNSNAKSDESHKYWFWEQQSIKT